MFSAQGCSTRWYITIPPGDCLPDISWYRISSRLRGILLTWLANGTLDTTTSNYGPSAEGFPLSLACSAPTSTFVLNACACDTRAKYPHAYAHAYSLLSTPLILWTSTRRTHFMGTTFTTITRTTMITTIRTVQICSGRRLGASSTNTHGANLCSCITHGTACMQMSRCLTGMNMAEGSYF